MIRTVSIGALLFVVFAVAFAPASLLRAPLSGSGADLLQPAGTVWKGSADLYLAKQGAGRISWRFRPLTLLQGALGYHVDLTGADHDLRGTVRLRPGTAEAVLDGHAASAFANRWLAPYDIVIAGDLTLQNLQLRVPYDLEQSRGGSAAGSVSWAGGPVRYRLSGRDHSARLPPLVAYLGDGLEAVVFPEGGQTPLLRARLQENGFLWIGVTKMMTRLAGNSWPGSHPDHEVVLEVEEQLF